MIRRDASPVLEIRGLGIEFPGYGGAVQALNGVTIEVAPGEIVGLVGESGSGKSVAAMAAIRLLPAAACRVTRGTIAVVGRDVLSLTEREMTRVRGRQVSMVFQEPMSALNPTLRVETQIGEMLRRHQRLDRRTARERIRVLFDTMQVPDPQRVMRSFPFELSGGMRQRVLLAMAFACSPQLLIADEPTTALDVTVQAQVLALLREHARAHGTAVLFISHDLAVVSQLCERLHVMYAGEIVERGAAAKVLAMPLHPYTRALLRSLPESAVPGRPLESIPGTVPALLNPPPGCRFAARCSRRQDRCEKSPPLAAVPGTERAVACWYAVGDAGGADEAVAASAAAGASAAGTSVGVESGSTAPVGTLVEIREAVVQYVLTRSWRGRPLAVVHALNGVDLDIRRGESLAVVGESGCGKSTLAQLVMALRRPNAGYVRFDGVRLDDTTQAALRALRPRFQMVFQDPQSSLDPRMSAWRLIVEPLVVGGLRREAELRRRAAELALLVGIRTDQLDRFAHEFSGGQRQRLAIARAIATQPELLVLDEPTSALDVSIQAQILNLLMELQVRLGLTFLFISHNVAVVRHVAQRVAVMYLGQIVELGGCSETLARPRHPYTRQLLGAVPRLHEPFTVPPAAPVESRGNLRLPQGCYFRSRCGFAVADCAAPQPLRRISDGRSVRCHRAQDIEGVGWS